MKCYCPPDNKNCDACKQLERRRIFRELQTLGLFAVGTQLHFMSGESGTITEVKEKVFKPFTFTNRAKLGYAWSDFHEGAKLEDGVYYAMDSSVEWCEGYMAIRRGLNPVTEIAEYLTTLQA